MCWSSSRSSVHPSILHPPIHSSMPPCLPSLATDGARVGCDEQASERARRKGGTGSEREKIHGWCISFLASSACCGASRRVHWLPSPRRARSSLGRRGLRCARAGQIWAGQMQPAWGGPPGSCRATDAHWQGGFRGGLAPLTRWRALGPLQLRAGDASCSRAVWCASPVATGPAAGLL